jgi:hypothetical protein
MLPPLLRRSVAGLATVAVFSLLFVTLGPSQDKDKPPKRERPAGKPIAMPANLVGLEIYLGLKDDKVTAWNGTVESSEGRVLEVEILRGNPKAKADGNRFTVSSVSRMQQKKTVVDGPILHVGLDAPPTATVTVSTEQGKFNFAVSDLAIGSPKTFLDGQASAERSDGAIRLTGRETEDDYPALAKAADGTVWLAYVEYTPGAPIVLDRIKAGGFEDLVPKGNGDCVRLMRYDGKTWQPPIDVTEMGLHVWRPTVAVDGKGNAVVAWSQQIDGDWEIFYRRYTPAKEGTGQWGDIVRLTNAPGSDFHVVSATDSAGVVWLAWQAWRKDNFEIMLAALADNHPWKEPKIISNSSANDWTPAIAADSKGNVHVAWDTYDKGNYDVRLATLSKDAAAPKIIDVANSAKYEARPSLVCDAKDRVWIAYEEGDEQWGKDNAGRDYKKVGFKSNLGYALYNNRTIKVKCLADGKLMIPAGEFPAGAQTKATLEQEMPVRAIRNRSLPRLSVDGAGGVWVLYRQHPLASLAGEVWNSYATRYDGKAWSAPRRLSASAHLLDNRPSLVPYAKGVLVVFSGDGRRSTQNRDQSDLFAAILSPLPTAQKGGGEGADPALIADPPAAEAKLAPVHPNERAEIARMRDYRIETGNKKLRLWRGEFHRHTEYSAHRDQDGMLEDNWRYALDPGGLDWIGIGDHDNGYGSYGDGHKGEFMWWHFQKTTELFHNPPGFTGAHVYERSVVYPNGHRNVIMPKPGIRPLPRGDTKSGTPEKGTPDTKLLYAYLKHFGGICASHTSATGMGTDWRDNSPEFEPIVEIYQGLRHNYEHLGAPRSATKETNIGGYEPAGFVWNALEKGYRFGFQASSDHVSTHLSYAVVLTDDITRQGMIDAFKKRHCYGATDNIILDVRSGEHIQGDAFETAKPPTLEILVRGTGPIAKLSIIRDNKYVYATEPKQQEVKLTWTDMDAKAGATSYYYVRIEQADTNLAWGSPMWITYKK